MLGQSHLRSKPCFYVLRKPAFGAIQPTTLGMGAAEMQEIAAIIASVLRATAPTRTASSKPSLANYTLDEGTRAQAEGRGAGPARALPLYPEIEL
jgi:glycine hydroxymethyltransferase